MDNPPQDYIHSLETDVFSANFRADTALRMIGQEFGPNKDIRILDIGCGLGQLLLKLSDNGYTQLSGIDNSPAAVEQLKARNQAIRADYINIEAEKLPYANDYFNVVICLEVFEHLYDPTQVLRKIHDVLQPGGIVIFSVPNEYRIYQRIRFLFGKPISLPTRVGGHIKFFSKSLFVQFVSQYLKVNSVEAIGNKRVRKFPFLTAVFPNLFAKWFFIVARKQS